MRFAASRVVLLPLLAIMTLYLISSHLFSSVKRTNLKGDASDTLHSNSHLASSTIEESKAFKVKKAFDEWHSCMVTKFEVEHKDIMKFWITFENMTNDCTAASGVSKIRLVPFENEDETKYYVFGQNVSEPSVIVSLGIGADVTAELQLKKKLAQGSEFFGADPVAKPNNELFSEVGTFFPLAVSKKTGLVESHVRENDGSYKTTNAASIDIVTFLNQFVNRTVIDHLILDNEGPEYDIVPMIAINKVFEENGVLVCHMNVEFHGAGPKERYQWFVDIISGILSAKRFASLYTLSYIHQRSFFINYDHPYCVQKYLTQFF